MRRRSLARAPARLVAAALLCIALSAAAAGSWQGIRLPDGWRPVALGEHLRVNGVPMQIGATLLRESPDAAARRLRETWGEPVQLQSSPQSPGHLLLGKAIGERFVTAQFIPADGGRSSRLLLSALALDDRSAAAAPWQRMPVGSLLLLDTQAVDGGRTSRHVAWANELGLLVNRDHVMQDLRAEGYALQSEQPTPGGAVEGRLLQLASPGAEATVVLRRDGLRTTVVLNTVRRDAGAPP